MKERGIIMTSESVRGILGGRKTQTRRVVKPQPELVGDADYLGRPPPGTYEWPSSKCRSMVSLGEMECLGPFGARGGFLWVRETWSKSALSNYPCPSAWYRADFARDDDPAVHLDHNRGCNGTQAHCFVCIAEREGKFRWQSPLFMPRRLSRITLKITDIRVQRVQDITEEDAIAEGITRGTDGWWNGATHPIKGNPKALPSARDAYATLWDEINSKREGGRYAWAKSPWVWAITFARVTP